MTQEKSNDFLYPFIAVVCALCLGLLLGTCTRSSEKGCPAISLKRIKRIPQQQKGFFFPIAVYSVRHHKPASESGRDVRPETWEYRGQYFYGYRPRASSSRRRAARLLAAGLPLLLAPLLSIILSFPVLVPIAQMTSAAPALSPIFGRKKKRKRRSEADYQERNNKLKDFQAVVNYLHQIDYGKRQQSRVVVNYLQCNGLLGPDDYCLERLSCEFSDQANSDAPEIEKTVTSILLGHILENELIPLPFKRRLKTAAVFGRNNTGMCNNEYFCPYVDDDWDFTSVYGKSSVTSSDIQFSSETE